MNDKAIRVIKPVVVPAQYLILAPLISCFVALFPGFFAFVISNMILRQFDPVFQYGLVVYVVAFVVCMVLIGFRTFNEPSWTTYTVFPDRLEYEEGWWNHQRRTLVFSQIIDVELTEGVLQQTQGAGTITLTTQQLVSAGEGQLSNRKIAFTNVPQPKEVYDLVRSLALKHN